MPKGTVKFFNQTKGFGFVVEADTTKEYFVHTTGCVDKIQNDDHIEFDLVEDKRGLKAVNVKRV